MPPTPTRKGPLSGQTIAGCKLGGQLGRGRTGNVYQARCKSIQGMAAVKILRGREAKNPELRKAFLREARAIAALDNENIVKIFDVLETEDTVVIVMQLLEGRNIWEMQQDGVRFKADRAARIVLQVARALAAAHRHKVVHRDIKPQNIIVCAKDQVKVVDFGLAALPGTGGDRVGTPHYMAPEQGARGRVDSAADVYSLGATFYHMLTGKTPYEGETVGEILTAHREGNLVSPKQVDAMIPNPIDRLVRQMMAPAKGYRPTAEALVEQMEEILAEGEWKRRRSQGGQRGEGEEEAGRPLGRRRRSGGAAGLLIGGVFGLIVILAVVLAFVLVNKNKSPSPESPRPDLEAETEVDTPKPPTPEEIARRRVKQADRALAEAEQWVAANRKDVEGGARRLEAVAHDFPKTTAGRRAGKAAVDMRMREEARKAEAARPKIDTEELKNRWEIYRRMLGKFRVEDVDGKLKVLERDARFTVYEEKAKNEREARLHIEFLRNSLIHAIYQSKKVPYTAVKPEHPDPSAMIYDADVSGIKVREGVKEWRRAWHDLVGAEVIGLSRACIPQKDKTLAFALGVYLVRAGFPEEAALAFDRTRLLQNAGEYNDRIESLGR